jgi:hypothetical protein
MATDIRPQFTQAEYEAAALATLASQTLEDLMEATPQAQQREIIMGSLAVVQVYLPDVQYYSELLLQYPKDGAIRWVVPDNMVSRSAEPWRARSSYRVEHDPPILMALEYVSPSSGQKDYGESFRKYERDLRIPYCLLYDTTDRTLEVYHHDGTRYVRLEPNVQGRVAVPELEIEVGLLDGWTRVWFRGQLVPVPAELQRQLDEQAAVLRRRTEELQQRERQLQKQGQELQQKDQQIRQKDQQVADLDRALREQQEAHKRLTERLRQQVLRRAQRKGRQDLVERLPTVTDPEQLERWLEDLDD